MASTPTDLPDAPPPDPRSSEPHTFQRRVLVAVLIGLALVLLALFAWYALYVLLLAFAGVLVAVLLRGLADAVSRWTRLGHGWSLGLVVVALAGAMAGLFWALAPSVARQADEFSNRLPHTVQTVEQRLMQYGWGRQLLNRPQPAGGGGSGGTQAGGTQAGGTQEGAGATDPAGSGGLGAGQTGEGQPASQPTSQPTSQPVRDVGTMTATAVQAIATGGASGSAVTTVRNALTRAFSGVVAVVVVLVVGIYMAATPQLYVRGFLHLLPMGHRRRVRDALYAVGHSLRWWLIGQGVTMVVIGVLTAVGLKIIGIKLWLAFGVLAALFNFIPNFGPLISFVPAFLFALAMSPTKAVWVVVLYVVAQSFEGYVLTPLVQKKAVNLPPALLILTQVLMGLLAGPIGVVLAAPLTAAALVTVQMLYVREALGDPVKVEGEPDGPGEASGTGAAATGTPRADGGG